MVYFDNCDVVINGSGILADSASVQSVNYLDPAYVLEKRGEAGQPVKDSIRSMVQISYMVEADNEPNLEIIETIKQFRSDDHVAKGFTVEVAGVSGTFYVQDYTLALKPNSAAQASVQFVTYEPLKGSLSSKKVGGDAVNYNQSNSIVNGWNTFITSSGAHGEFPTYDFSYQFRAQWVPIYAIGGKYPKQVQLMNASEMLNLTSSVHRHITFSGERAEDAFSTEFGSDMVIEAFEVDLLCDSLENSHLSLTMSGGLVVNTSLEARVGDIVRTKIGVNRNY
jgi:hypothetical protein